MKVSFNNGKTWVEAENIRISQEVLNPCGYESQDDEDLNPELIFNFFDRGLCIDVYIDNVCQGSKDQSYLEIGDSLV